MKTKINLWLSSFLMVILVLGACAPAATATQAPAASPAAVEATVPAKTDAEMEATLEEKLAGSPHTLEFIYGQKKTAEQWSETLDQMIEYGAKINAEEKAMLIEWLVNRQ